ncbi:MAG: Jag N-terminal domain-containing protein, partial [Clostridia bacterium]|nr:Jag N-terminal domain-containing protein [Clostridia bacterium]
MRSMEFSGRSVDEAIFIGLKEMGVTIDEVEIETIQSESKGLFGLGSKMAVVRLTEREVPLVMEMERAFANSRQPRREERPRGGDHRRRGGERPQGRERGGERREREPVPEERFDYSLELAEATPAACFLKELLEKMGISAAVLAANTDNGLRLCIDADTMGLLIGRRGETLDALQYI